jgi:hypothetical protein
MGSVVDRDDVEEMVAEETEYQRFVARLPGQPGFLSTPYACDPRSNGMYYVDPSGWGTVQVYRSETERAQCSRCQEKAGGSLHCIITRDHTVCLYCYYKQRTAFLSRYLLVMGCVCEAAATVPNEYDHAWRDLQQCLWTHVCAVLVASLDADVLIDSFYQRYPTQHTPQYLLSRTPASLLFLTRYRLHRRDCYSQMFSLIDPDQGAGIVCVPVSRQIYRCYKSKRGQLLWTFHKPKFQPHGSDGYWPDFISQIHAFARRFPRHEYLDYCIVSHQHMGTPTD